MTKPKRELQFRIIDVYVYNKKNKRRVRNSQLNENINNKKKSQRRRVLKKLPAGPK